MPAKNTNRAIALLATGDEITTGEILNTNGQNMARQLFAQGVGIGTHIVVADEVPEIEAAIRYLLQDHPVVIITGGLGPTTDDITRNAVSAYVNKPLIFDDTSWHSIVDKHNKIGIKTSDMNRQQAMFPQGAEIFPNHNGTAPGCFIYKEQKEIYLLPGPPHECLPIFEKHILPKLVQQYRNDTIQRLKWTLFGPAESVIAEKLEHAVKDFTCKTGYRWHFPYIDFKVEIAMDQQPEKLIEQVEPVIKPYLISHTSEGASELLRPLIAAGARTISISDKITGGLLEAALVNTKTRSKLMFAGGKADINVHLSGLAEYWGQAPQANETQLQIDITAGGKKKHIEKTIPLRFKFLRRYVVELVCFELWKHLNTP